MTDFEKTLLDFSTSFPKDLQRKIETFLNRKSDKSGEFLDELLEFIDECYDGGPEEFLDAWWKEMVRKGVVSSLGLGLKVPPSKPWRESEPINVFHDGIKVGGEYEMLSGTKMDIWPIIYNVYLRHDYCANVLWDTILKEIGREDFEYWLDGLLKENGISVLSISKSTETEGAVGELLDEIYDVYSSNGLFFPIEVNGGRKFQGLGYVISQKYSNYNFHGHNVSTTVCMVWDPVAKTTGEFNCGSYNLVGIARTHMNELDKWGSEKFRNNFDLEVDVTDEERALAFRDYFIDLINHAKSRCGSDYRYMKNYINVCTNRMLSWELLNRIIEVMVKKTVMEGRKVDTRPLRAFTNALIEDAEQGLISWEEIARSALDYMSEDDVQNMAESEFDYEESDDDEEYEDMLDDGDLYESCKSTITMSQLKKLVTEGFYDGGKTRRSAKRTANYQIDADDLELFIQNDSDLYDRAIVPTIVSLQKKFKRGVYNHDRAVDAWKHVADMGARAYDEQIGDEEGNTARRFEGNVAVASVDTRMEVAKRLADHYFDNVNGNNPLIIVS